MFGWKNKTNEMQRRAVETSGAFDGGLAMMTHGMMAGTQVASNLGWRNVEALAVGDAVLTFDNGMQPITEIRRRVFWLDAPETDAALWPVVVPAGALDNQAELTLLADQGVMVESDAATDMYGDPFAVVPAIALVGVRGITRRAPRQQVEVIALYFADEQMIYAEGGALVHCPVRQTVLDSLLTGAGQTYDVLSNEDAMFLAECIAIEDHVVATGGCVTRAEAAPLHA